MAFTAANVRFSNGAVGFFAKRAHFHHPLETKELAFYGCFKPHVFAGIG